MRRALLFGSVWLLSLAVSFAAGHARAQPQFARVAAPGYVIEHDADVRVAEPGPHRGGGRTTGYPFFSEVADLGFAFRKRALHPGAAIGFHPQESDEVYYVLSGTGEMRLNERSYPVGPGSAILTRPGTSHGLHQTGREDLVIIIVYPRH